jgi:hypothetical protein
MDGTITGTKGKLILGDWALQEFWYLSDCSWEFTEKVDGTNIRVGLTRKPGQDTTDVEFAGRTDNATIPPALMWALEGLFGDATANKKITEWMVKNDLTEVLLFGEGFGPKIQGGGKYRSDHSFVLFDVKIGKFWLNRHNVNDGAKNLGIEHVPVVAWGTLEDGIAIVKDNLRSHWGDFEAEGLVARTSVPLFNRKGERVITKIKARDFR